MYIVGFLMITKIETETRAFNKGWKGNKFEELEYRHLGINGKWLWSRYTVYRCKSLPQCYSNSLTRLYVQLQNCYWLLTLPAAINEYIKFSWIFTLLHVITHTHKLVTIVIMQIGPTSTRDIPWTERAICCISLNGRGGGEGVISLA